jgi:hypothetical protein
MCLQLWHDRFLNNHQKKYFSVNWTCRTWKRSRVTLILPSPLADTKMFSFTCFKRQVSLQDKIHPRNNWQIDNCKFIIPLKVRSPMQGTTSDKKATKSITTWHTLLLTAEEERYLRPRTIVKAIRCVESGNLHHAIGYQLQNGKTSNLRPLY